jgi:sugar lactone lactonase YvrE
MSERLHADVVLDVGATLGEGPVWDHETSRLLWVDITRKLVHTFDPATGADETVDVGSPVGAVASRAGGGWVLALADGFAVTDPGSTVVRLVSPVDAEDPTIRFNDGKVDPAGRFWAGTMAYDGTPGAGTLYRLNPDHEVSVALEGVTISNGLGWSPDRRTMYFIDTPTARVDAFDYDADTGAITDRRLVVDIDAGAPDGMTVDAEGGLWVALWDGWAVRRYLPDSRLDRVIEVPAQRVTSCTFGGEALDTLYITSARSGLEPSAFEEQPHAGALFAVNPGVRGIEPSRFAG